MAMRLDRLGTRERVGLVLAVLALFALLVEKFVFQAWLQSCRSFEAETVVLEQELKYQAGVGASSARVEAIYESMRGLVGTAASAEETVDGLKGEIDDLARRSGVSVLSMEHRAPIPAGPTELYTVVIGSFEAETKDLLTFLAQLHETPGMLRVTKLTLSPGKPRSQVKGTMVITKLKIAAGSGSDASQ